MPGLDGGDGAKDETGPKLSDALQRGSDLVDEGLTSFGHERSGSAQQNGRKLIFAGEGGHGGPRWARERRRHCGREGRHAASGSRGWARTARAIFSLVALKGRRKASRKPED